MAAAIEKANAAIESQGRIGCFPQEIDALRACASS
jgi:hypothetical protein